MLTIFHQSDKWYNELTGELMTIKDNEKPRFHQRVIKRGKYGELSKVLEEVEEAIDAEEQGHRLMLLIELSDIVGAVEGVLKKERLQSHHRGSYQICKTSWSSFRSKRLGE